MTHHRARIAAILAERPDLAETVAAYDPAGPPPPVDEDVLAPFLNARVKIGLTRDDLHAIADRLVRGESWAAIARWKGWHEPTLREWYGDGWVALGRGGCPDVDVDCDGDAYAYVPGPDCPAFLNDCDNSPIASTPPHPATKGASVSDALTLLLVCPPDDPLGLLADSVGGGRVPVRYRHRWTAKKPPRGLTLRWMQPPHGEWGPWVHFVVSPHNTETEHALLLSHRGTVDEIGMARAEHVFKRDDLPFPTCWPDVAEQVVDANPRMLGLVTVAVSIIHRAPGYRLARVGEDGREVGS